MGFGFVEMSSEEKAKKAIQGSFVFLARSSLVGFTFLLEKGKKTTGFFDKAKTG